MSKGPGKIERAIRALFDANPNRAFITDELVEHCYPEAAHYIEKKHTVAVLRAAHKVISRDPNWWSTSISYGRNVGLCFFNGDSVESYALMRLITDYVMYRSRRPTIGRGVREVSCHDDLRAMLDDDDHRALMAPGGSWHRHVEMHRAKRDGDHQRLAELEDLQARDIATHVANIEAILQA